MIRVHFANYPVLAVLAGIAASLLSASLVIWLLGIKNRNSDYSELRSRVKSGGGWWRFFQSQLRSIRQTAVVFFGFLSFSALKEFLSLIPTGRADRRVLFWAYRGSGRWW